MANSQFYRFAKIINDVYEVVISVNNGRSTIRLRASDIPEAYRHADYYIKESYIDGEIVSIEKSFMEILEIDIK